MIEERKKPKSRPINMKQLKIKTANKSYCRFMQNSYLLVELENQDKVKTEEVRKMKERVL